MSRAEWPGTSKSPAPRKKSFENCRQKIRRALKTSCPTASPRVARTLLSACLHLIRRGADKSVRATQASAKHPHECHLVLGWSLGSIIVV